MDSIFIEIKSSIFKSWNSHQDKKKLAWHFKLEVNLLIDNKLQNKLGTWRTSWSVRSEEILIDLFPAIIESDPSTIFIFVFPMHRLLEENKFEESVIWSVAPESMIYGQFELRLTRDMGRWLPF